VGTGATGIKFRPNMSKSGQAYALYTPSMPHPTSFEPDASDTSDAGIPLPFAYQKQCVLDAAQRMQNGLLLYPVIWPVLMLADGYWARHTLFALVNTLCLLGASMARLLIHHHLRRALDNNFPRTQLIFRLLSLGYNLYWGCLCAVVMTAPDAQTLRWMTLMSTVGITAGGTVIVAIDSVLPMLYPICTLGPTVVTLLPQGGTTNIAITALTAILFSYSIGISRIVGRDYWARQRTQALLEQRARELEAISRTDALTQVPNRLKFQESLTQSWRDGRRRHEPLALAMIDLDHFKRINDNHGHPFGDRCLQAAARALQAAVHRPADLVARYGGEEFVLLMPNTDLAGACKVVQRILEQVSETVIKQEGHMVTLSCSIGVAMCIPTMTDLPEQLVQEADSALYFAKQSGRARYAFADPSRQGEWVSCLFKGESILSSSTV
jgi:diguanylate cyclase (GGDEF)-like protein